MGEGPGGPGKGHRRGKPAAEAGAGAQRLPRAEESDARPGGGASGGMPGGRWAGAAPPRSPAENAGTYRG